MGTGWRVMFLGQGPLAEFAFGRLVELGESGGLSVLLACSNTSGEDTWWGSARVRELSSERQTRFIPNTERHDSALAEAAASSSINCLISVGHPWVVSERVLASVAGVAFNLHNAPLPRFGGFHTCSHAILEGETRFGATLHWMETAPDAGPIAFEEGFAIPEDITAKGLHRLTLEAGRRLFVQLVSCLVGGRLPPKVRMSGPARIYPRGALDTRREISDITDDIEVDRKSRALWFPPFEPAFHVRQGKRYYVVPPRGFPELVDVR